VAELLSNAVQHGVGDSADDRAVTLRLHRQGRRLTVEVSDNGAGLAADFDPTESAGLGLKIVKTLVTEELSGAVSWEPRSPTGTRVVIDVLVAPAPPT
jgi:two-component sensor histidine kinase